MGYVRFRYDGYPGNKITGAARKRKCVDNWNSLTYNVGERKCRMMAVRLNEDQDIVKTVREGLKRTGGYCPCRLERTEDNKCICKEFREQIADPDFKGYCHCMLYYKD